jgi:hypothetical protein
MQTDSERTSRQPHPGNATATPLKLADRIDHARLKLAAVSIGLLGLAHVDDNDGLSGLCMLTDDIICELRAIADAMHPSRDAT